jgi:LPS export ABC transporter permease LptG/LPS export ABC transporter permease LptF
VFKTLDRYLVREILPPMFLSLLIFTFILCLPPVMDQLEALVSKGVAWGTAGRILLTLVPQALGLTIPMSLLVGLLIGLGRMSGDREAVALLACGVSPYRLLRPVLLLAALAGGIHLWVMLRAIPDANQTFRQITYDVVSQQLENDVKPQVFFTTFPNWVLYARDVPPGGGGGWKDVLVADTSKQDSTTIYLARRGRLILDRQKQSVELVLEDGTRYSNRGADGRQAETYRFQNQLILTLDPKTVFPKIELLRGMNELTIPQLWQQAGEKAKNGLPAHQEMEAIQQRFSFPAACLVFAIIGVALGLTVARDGKLAGFVVGIAVIFGYYVILYLGQSVTRGYYSGAAGGSKPLLLAQLSRWAPNLVLLPFGMLALIWRARWAEGRLPFRSAVKLTQALTGWLNRHRDAETLAPGSRPAPRGRGVVVVIRVPHLSWLQPNILDRYISRIYLRAAALSFAALIGIFYIGTFIDKSDKLFKGQATAGMVVELLGYMTPQFIYFVIPLAALLSVLVTFGLLSRTSELSVMKACGISLYRIAAPLLVLSVVWSGVLFALEQKLLARANEQVERIDAAIRNRPPRTSSPINRTWLVGRDGDIYHYTRFDSQLQTIHNLVIFRPLKGSWELESQMFTPKAAFAAGQWVGTSGWHQEFTGRGRWTAFPQRTLPLEPPDYFETEQPIAEMMTVPELRRFIEEQAASGINVVPLTIDLQKKLAFPLVTVVMTLLAIPFGMTTGKRGTLYGIGIGIVMALSYYMLGNAFAAIGKAGMLDPILAGWAPNILAAGTAAYLMLTART